MDNEDGQKKDLIRISELSRETGVSIPALHFYSREGLIAPSVKTARNMAYYDRQCIDDVRYIKELQTRKYLPLSVIKLIIRSRRSGQETGHLQEMETFVDSVFQPVEISGQDSLSMQELVKESGLSVSEIDILDSTGLITSTGKGRGRCYSDLDLRICRTVADLKQYGLEAVDFKVYRYYLQSVQREYDVIHRKIHESNKTGSVPIIRLIESLNTLKICLAGKVARQAFVDHPHDEEGTV